MQPFAGQVLMEPSASFLHVCTSCAVHRIDEAIDSLVAIACGFGELLKPLLGEAFAKGFGECVRLLSSIFFFKTVAGFLKPRPRFGVGPLSLKTSFDRREDRIRLCACGNSHRRYCQR